MKDWQVYSKAIEKGLHLQYIKVIGGEEDDDIS